MNQRKRPNFWMERLTWSWQVSFLAFIALALLFVMPGARPVGAQAGAGAAFLFPGVFALLFTIYAANFGQLQGDPHRAAREAHGRRLLPHAAQLTARLSLLLALSLPLWVVFHFAYHLRPTSLLALAYLWGYGLTWAGFGLWMALMNFTEIFQFKLKYALMILYLGTTLFVAHPLSPFLTLQVLLNPDGLSPANGPFLAGSFAWVVGALALVAAGGRAGLICGFRVDRRKTGRYPGRTPAADHNCERTVAYG